VGLARPGCARQPAEVRIARQRTRRLIAHCARQPKKPAGVTQQRQEGFMTSNRDAATTSARPLDPTGRDGAIDFAVNAAEVGRSGDGMDHTGQFASLMGAAIIDLWSELPRDVQERLFEHAVALGQRGGHDDMMREQLAKFLHEHHERTAR
jgi:hypothetical protein